jgi:ATP-dependent helicase/nuclease subunit A
VVEQWGRALSLPPIEKITDSFQEAEVLGEEFDSWLATLEGSTRESIFQSYSWSDIRVLAFQLYQKRHSLKGIASDFSRFNDILTLLSPFFEKVKTKLLQKGAYSFDDLEYYAVHILNEIPDSLSFYRNQLKQLCVDEFQDTSPAQWELVQLLTGLDYSKLFLVGDPKQSIYRFRQADVGIFLEATEKISHEKGDFLTLQDNFRSHPEIIYWINQKAQSLFIESSIPYLTLNAKSENIDTAASYPRLRRISFSENEEKLALITYVNELTKQVPEEDSIGILFRVSDKIASYASALADTGYTVSAKRTGKLFETYDILDLYYFFKLLKDTSDNLAMAVLLRSPYFSLSYQEIHTLFSRKESTLYEKWKSSHFFRPWLEELIQEPNLQAEDALSRLFLETSYFPEKTSLFLMWLEASFSEPLTVADLIRKMDYWKYQDIAVPWEESTEGRIKLSTVHGAKGLEYDHLILVDLLRRGSKQSPWLFLKGTELGVKYRASGELMESELYKKLKEQESVKEIEESNRLLYVALTRAKKSLAFFLPENPELIPKNTWGFQLHEWTLES